MQRESIQMYMNPNDTATSNASWYVLGRSLAGEAVENIEIVESFSFDG